MPPPLVSIVIPCYQGASLLPRAIRSCLDQDYPALEIIVVDDASPDESARVAEEFARDDARIRVVRREKNGGVAAAFNSGYEIARGDYLTRLAHDDWFEASAIRELALHLDTHPEVDLVYANDQLVHESTGRVEPFQRPEPGAALTRGNHLGICVMWRRAVWERTERFNSYFDSAEDYDYWERASRQFTFAHLGGRPLLSVLHHGTRISKRFAGKQEMLSAEILARYAKEPADHQAVANFYLNAAYNYGVNRERLPAFHCLWQAMRQRPFDPAVLRRIPGILRRILL